MSLWDTFTGATGKKQAAQTLARNNATANTGYDANQGYLSRGYESATGRLQPYAEQGQQANRTYSDMLGINGAGPQRAARTGYEGWNPYLSGDMDLATRAVARRQNAGGNYNSGMNLLAQQRATQELGSRDFYNYNDRLAGQGQQGYGAAGAMAGLDTGYAQGQVSNRNALTGQLTGNQSAYSQAYNQASTGGLQNILGLGTLGLQAYLGAPPKNQAHSDPGTAANGGWSTTTTRAPGNNFSWGW